MSRPLIAAAALAAIVLTGCSSSPVEKIVDPKDPVELGATVKAAAKDVPVDTIVTASADHGSLDAVTLTAGKASIDGRISDGRWIASERLEPGTTYDLKVTGTGEDAKRDTLKRSFTTQKLSLDEQTYPAVAPLKGETVGVGMPIIVRFDRPVENKALFERNMFVRTDPTITEGSWNWFSDNEARFRPKEFWPAGTKVTVDLELNSLPAGNGIYGQQDQTVPFSIGRKVVSTVDLAAHQLTVRINGDVARKIPVSSGDASHRTRAGTKIIMEKFPSVDMDAASTGVDADAPDYYNIKGVKWSMRLTNSGEFLHAAPWSVGSQGRANVSHGCTGMSTANADWLYHASHRGDVVKFVNSPRGLEPRNGWTDWNVSWSDWTRGSALS